MSEMSEHRYSRKSLLWDYARGGGGLLVVLGPLVMAPMLGFFQFLFAALTILFAGYLLRTWQRARTTVLVDERGIATIGPLGRSIEWSSLSAVKLGYFATRRDRKGGWMQLTLRGPNGRIAIDSELSGFEEILPRVGEAALRNRLELSPASAENFAAAGVTAPASTVPPPGPPRRMPWNRSDG